MKKLILALLCLSVLYAPANAQPRMRRFPQRTPNLMQRGKRWRRAPLSGYSVVRKAILAVLAMGVFCASAQAQSHRDVNGTMIPAVSSAFGNPISTLTLPATTTAYSAGNLIASSATAGSISVPSFNIASTGNGAFVPRVRLSTNDATSTAWGSVSIQVDLWSAAPTFTNGDRGAWSPATGTGSHLGAYSCTMSAEYGDGAYAECAPSVGSAPMPFLQSGTAIYWTLEAESASGTTGASKVFTLTAEVLN